MKAVHMAFNGAPQKEWEPGEEFHGLNCVGQGVFSLSKMLESEKSSTLTSCH